MALKTQSFTIRKGDNLNIVSAFLNFKIGLDAYLIKDISSTKINDQVTELSITYQDSPNYIVESYSPRPGAILTTGVFSNTFDSRILFNIPIDPNSIQSGSFIVDGNGLSTGKVYVDPNANNYFVKLDLSDSIYKTTDFHEIRIDSSKIRRQNNIPLEYSPIAGYVVNTSTTFHLGDKPDPYFERRRGRLEVDTIRSTSNNIQQAIEEYFNKRSLDKEKLVKYTSCSSGNNFIDIYLIYLDKLEPQIIEGFPLNNAFVPDTSINDNLTLVFNTKLDPEHLTNTVGLFTIESGFNTSVNIAPSDITILSDLRTVRISITSYLGPERIYSIIARPGIRSYDGLVKQKPEQWVFHITELASSSFTGTFSGLDEKYVVWGTSAVLSNERLLINSTGIYYNVDSNSVTIGISGDFYTGVTGHISSNANPHSTTAAQVGAPTLLQFTGHTGDQTFHYTQSQIQINTTQVTDFTNQVQDTAASIFQFSNGITGTYNSSTNVFSLSGRTATYSTPGVVSFNINQFEIVGGSVTFTGTGAGGGSYTNEQAQDAIGDILLPSPSIGLGYNDITPSITGYVIPGGVDHNQLLNYEVNRHLDHSTIFITGVGDLGGGGAITTSSGIFLKDTAITPGTYGSSTQVPVITVDQRGRLTNSTNQTIDAPSVSVFNTHTGDTTIHFTQGQINHTAILNIGTNTHSQIDTHIASTSNPHSVTASQVGAPTTIQFTGHTGDLTVHYTQAQISIPSTQISDFTEAVQDTVGAYIRYAPDAGITGTYDDSSNIYTFTGISATTSVRGIASFNSSQFTVTNGAVTITGISTGSVTNLSEVIQDSAASMIRFGAGLGITGNYDDSANTFTLSGIEATTSTKGVASFNNTYFTVNLGAVSFITGALKDLYTLDDLSNVTLSSPSVGQSIIYNGSSFVGYTAFTGVSITGGTLISNFFNLTGKGAISVRQESSNLVSISGSIGGGGGGLSDGDYGDITVGGGGTTLTIDNDTIDTFKLSNMPARTILANPNSSTADPEYVTAVNILSQILTGVILTDGSRAFESTVSGFAPWGATSTGHLITAQYLDDWFNNALTPALLSVLSTYTPLNTTLSQSQTLARISLGF